jgi:hypothetical protein
LGEDGNINEEVKYKLTINQTAQLTALIEIHKSTPNILYQQVQLNSAYMEI